MNGPEREELLLESHSNPALTTPPLQGLCGDPLGHPLGTQYVLLPAFTYLGLCQPS